MRKRNLPWLLIFFIGIFITKATLSQPVTAHIVLNLDSQTNTIISIQDIETKEILTNALIHMQLTDLISKKTTIYDFQSDDSGRFGIFLLESTYRMIVKIDDIATPGNDYYGEFTFTRDNRTKIILDVYPVATLRGEVFDKLDNLMSGSMLQFECISKGSLPPNVSDEVGTFVYAYMPRGDCKVYARFRDAVGMAHVHLSRGELADVQIRLDRSVASMNKDSNAPSYALGAFFLAILLGVGLVIAKGLRRKEEINTPALASRTKDIMRTLNEREKKVVDFLLEHNMESPQNTLRYKTKIPKTSLARILENLEKKKIIEIDREGRMKKIRLSYWFLGKES